MLSEERANQRVIHSVVRDRLTGGRHYKLRKDLQNRGGTARPAVQRAGAE